MLLPPSALTSPNRSGSSCARWVNPQPFRRGPVSQDLPREPPQPPRQQKAHTFCGTERRGPQDLVAFKDHLAKNPNIVLPGPKLNYSFCPEGLWC